MRSSLNLIHHVHTRQKSKILCICSIWIFFFLMYLFKLPVLFFFWLGYLPCGSRFMLLSLIATLWVGILFLLHLSDIQLTYVPSKRSPARESNPRPSAYMTDAFIIRPLAPTANTLSWNSVPSFLSNLRDPEHMKIVRSCMFLAVYCRGTYLLMYKKKTFLKYY